LWSGAAAYCDAGVVQSAEKAAATGVSSMSSWHTKYEILLQQQCRPLALSPSSINETDSIYQTKSSKAAREDVEIIASSLHFIDNFSNMLTRVSCCCQQAQVKLAPTDLKDVLEPVCNMLYQRDGDVDVSVSCPKESDCRNGYAPA
jgi:hypothetical protein